MTYGGNIAGRFNTGRGYLDGAEFDLWSNFVTAHQRINKFNVFNADFAAPKFGHSKNFATLSLSLSGTHLQ